MNGKLEKLIDAVYHHENCYGCAPDYIIVSHEFYVFLMSTLEREEFGAFFRVSPESHGPISIIVLPVARANINADFMLGVLPIND